MGRGVASIWHAAFSISAGLLYFFFVLPRWPELVGDAPHALGTAGRITAGVVIALAALPVVFTLLRSRKPEFGTPALALTLLTASVVAHVLAGVLIVGTAISEIWLSLDSVGQYLFGIYGAAAAVAVLGIFGFYLSFVAELPPPPPKPLKPKKDKKQRRRGKKDSEAEAADETTEIDETADEDAEDTADDDAETAVSATESGAADEPDESPDVESTAMELESTADEATVTEARGDPAATEEAAEDESTTGGLRNRRPTGKGSGTHRRRRSRRGVAVED